jgi:hydrogenase maturation protein HypF
MSASAPAALRTRPVGLRVHVTGLVQGVGFRPFVHRLALRYGLVGSVQNRAGDVRIDVQGPRHALEQFLAALSDEAPPLARIECIDTAAATLDPSTAFLILPSAAAEDHRQSISPDVALCAACEAELFDPANRRCGYAFITCTDCGPRFTVIEGMPYDRERTTMRAFVQCAACLDEYRTPGNRRYHSETNSCPGCGPRLWLEGPPAPGGDADPIRAAADLLTAGQIVALRGLGGFHLAADATSELAVQRLRARKHRDAKPLAVMVRTLEQARALGDVSLAEAELLTGSERPIVLLRRRGDGGLAPAVAPGLDTVGVMLAYTPLHHLLLAAVGRPLVMTSGNRAEEPIAIDNDDARGRLGKIADALLLHDRDIAVRHDDSVLRVVDGAPMFLRRGRGYAPLPFDLPIASPRPLVAVGPHLKNTFTLVHERRAFISPHIGDLENLETLEHFEATLAAYRRVFRINPRVAVRDLHPAYLSTQLADDMGLERVIAVQHHHAHVAAVLAEHGGTGPAVGVAYDGTGYGADGRTWGAEVLVADLTGYRRAGRLRYVPLPGGDLAARQPWRAAAGYLSLEPERAPAFTRAFAGIDPVHVTLVAQQIAAGLHAPLASSMGRLFDAAAAVLGVRLMSRYEGHAAMELERLAGDRRGEPLPFPLTPDATGCWIMDPVPLLAALGERAQGGVDVADLAAAFHDAVVRATAQLVERVAGPETRGTVALGGGVFQNARLLATLRRRLAARGLTVLVPRRLSPNDGAVSYGQAAVAAALLHTERED